MRRLILSLLCLLWLSAPMLALAQTAPATPQTAPAATPALAAPAPTEKLTKKILTADHPTWCPGCGAAVIERDWYAILAYRLDAHGACQACGHRIAGRYGEFHGAFGPRRVPVHVRPI